ncbi:MAG: hypothetical protein NZ898_15870, partial [Myxococcota bacterium]|nr:hypothetical protein [Myxococcota bacterium]
LLTSMIRSDPNTVLGLPYGLWLVQAATEPSPSARVRRLRELGDATLYGVGFFGAALEHRGVSRRYVLDIGRRAYRAAASGPVRPVLVELADAIGRFALVLDDVREQTALRTPQDIVRLYDRWRRTGSPLLAERLGREGVFPQRPGRGRTLH